MFTVAKSGVFARPIAEVFAFLGDQTNASQWQAAIVEVHRTTEGPPRVGATHTLVRTFMGRPLAATNEYIAYEPNSWIAFKSTSGPVPFEASYRLESAAEGTKVTSTVVMRPTGLMGLMAPLMARSLDKEMSAAFSQLKIVLERPASVA
ncbi:MAG: SRPBCC family protein [Chloroflexota bacterium]